MISCPQCEASIQPTSSNGFRCPTCQTDVRFVPCRRCGATFKWFGAVTGGKHDFYTFKCDPCGTLTNVTVGRLREISAEVRRVEGVAKAMDRANTADEKNRKRLHVEARQAQVDAGNESIKVQLASLESLLAATLDRDDYIDFESLKETPAILPFVPGSLANEEPPSYIPLELPSAPNGLAKLLPGAKARYEIASSNARQEHEEALRIALEGHRLREENRKRDLAARKAEYDRETATILSAAKNQHSEITSLQQRFEGSDPAAIVSYFARVLEASQYPDNFPRHTKLAFVPESKQLVVEFELPSLESIPRNKSYKYVKTRDEIDISPLPEGLRRSLYASVIAQLTIRTVHELFESDRQGKLETIVFNGYVNSTDKRTGAMISPYLVTLRTTRDAFERLDLGGIDPAECLKGLHAGVSRSPAELAPVRPVLDFNMVDERFVEESDVLSGLDTRPNLMELTPSEFEALITNLFEKMGLETRMTRASRDGGVDCIAWDQRPIFGGKVVIQAKRYKNTVGVSAVRDLFGTLMNEGGSKGILVATSGYGKAAFDFASNKPLELLDGSNLLFLLRDHVGIEARIEVPEDWVDPLPDF